MPADACCIAGGIANGYFTYVEFLKFIAENTRLFTCALGTKTLSRKLGGRFEVDCEFTASKEKMAYFLIEAEKIRNVQLLENRIADLINCFC